jgi:hypothetical protein
MEKFRELSTLKTTKFVLVAVAIWLIVGNLASMWNAIDSRYFDQDEFQHTHIAWNMFNGLLPYRDFFEHHGPLYAELNTKILQFLIDTPDSFETLIFLRKTSFLFIALTALFVFLVAKVISQSKTAAFFSAAVFLSWEIVQKKGIEIRPDVLQNLFWMIGCYAFVIGWKKPQKIWPILAGMFWALMISCNAKAAVGAVGIIFFLILEFTKKDQRSLVLRQALWICAGCALILSIIFIRYAIEGAFTDLIYYNVSQNLNAISDRPQAAFVRSQMLSRIYANNLALVVSSLVGIAAINLKSPQQLALFLAIVPCIFGVYKGLFSQFYLIFIPILCVFFAHAIKRFVLSPQISSRFNIGAKVAICCSILWIVIVSSIQNSNFYRKRDLDASFTMSKNTIEWVLEHAARDERMVSLWIRCGGYIFNKDIEYQWLGLKKEFIDNFESSMEYHKPRLLFASERGLKNSPLAAYIRKKYAPIDEDRMCVWERKN